MMSEQLGSLFAALAKAQGKIDNVSQDREVEVPIKDKNNPGQYKGKYKFRYSTMAGILNHIRGPLTENELWFSQRIEDAHMVTRIFHSSGEWMDTGHIPVPNVKGTPQDVGSINSYFRRYSLGSAFALASEEDNDGEMGDREVSFRARGERRDEPDDHRPVETGIEEPQGGWGDWARELIEQINRTGAEDELDTIRDENKRLINGASKIDKFMYEAIGKAFKDRRAVLNDGMPF